MRVTPYIHIMAAHIPWFFEKYSAVKMFTGQDVEKNNDVARSIVLRKSNKLDSTGDVLRFETRQWLLKTESENRENTIRNNMKQKGIKWISKKSKQELVDILTSII